MTQNQPTILSSVLVFTGVYLGLAILLNGILWALEAYANFTMDSNAIGMLPLIIGAMQAGQRYGSLTGAKPASGYSWTVGLLFILVSLVLSLGLLYALAAYEGIDPVALVQAGLRDLQSEGISGPIVAAVLGGIILLLWVGTRFAFSFGAGNGVKMAAKLAEKRNR
jgi:hypothetical protein